MLLGLEVALLLGDVLQQSLGLGPAGLQHGSVITLMMPCTRPPYLLALLYHAAAGSADLLGDLLTSRLGIGLLDLLGDELALLDGPLLALLPDVDVVVLGVEAGSEALAGAQVAPGELERVAGLLRVPCCLAAPAEHGARGDGD